MNIIYVLITVCLNGAQGCTYSMGPTVVLDVGGTYLTRSECEKAAQEFADRYDDPGLYGVCKAAFVPEKSP